MVCIYGLFKPSLSLELSIKKIEERGFGGEKLLVVVLAANTPGRQTLLDSMYNTDGTSLVDGVSIAASIGMILGVIYGSVVSYGPIALGLAGMVVGGTTGYLLDRLINKRRQPRGAAPTGEIIVAVRCDREEDAIQVENIMKENQSTAVGRGKKYL